MTVQNCRLDFFLGLVQVTAQIVYIMERALSDCFFVTL